MKAPSTLVVIVTYNSSSHIQECLDSIKPSQQLVDVLVVDNDSKDDTLDLVKPYTWVNVAAQPENLGYAGGNNVGLRYAQEHQYTYTFIVNPDVRLESRSLERLITSIESHHEYGVICPVLTYADGNTIWYAGAHIGKEHFEPLIDHYRQPIGSIATRGLATVESMIGAAALVRVSALAQVGLLDEQFFLYCEETDWSLEFAKHSWLIGCDMGARFIHNVSSSTGGEGSQLPSYYYTRNVLLFAQKHAPDKVAAAVRYRYRCAFAHLKLALLGREGHSLANVRAMVRGIRDFRRGQFGRMKA
jgi:GT2 family glycosyltransferase